MTPDPATVLALAEEQAVALEPRMEKGLALLNAAEQQRPRPADYDRMLNLFNRLDKYYQHAGIAADWAREKLQQPVPA